MADPIPSQLEGVQLASLSSSENQVYRTNDSEIGPATYELLSEDVPTEWQVQWKLSPFLYQLFESWYKNALTKGVISFIITLPTGAGDIPTECNFKGRYSTSRIGRITVITATLREIEKKYNTAAEFDELVQLADLIDGFYKEDAFRAFINFAFVDLPDAWQDLV